MKNLLEKVRAIDKDAADYIQSEVLPRWEVETPIKKAVEKMSLESQLSILFQWLDSPQVKEDPEYWHRIYKQLGD